MTSQHAFWISAESSAVLELRSRTDGGTVHPGRGARAARVPACTEAVRGGANAGKRFSRCVCGDGCTQKVRLDAEEEAKSNCSGRSVKGVCVSCGGVCVSYSCSDTKGIGSAARTGKGLIATTFYSGILILLTRQNQRRAGKSQKKKHISLRKRPNPHDKPALKEKLAFPAGFSKKSA